MTPGERIAKARRAEEQLRDMQWVFDEVRDDLTKALEASAFGDYDTHHNLAIGLQVLKQIQSKLQAVIGDGKMAEAEVEQENWISRMKRRMA